MNDLDLEVIERRTNRHGRGFNAQIQTDLYVKDKTMDIKFQKIAGQRRIKNSLKTAMDFTEEELDTFSTALEELRLLMDDNGDDFLDAPLNNQINFINRWQYLDLEKGWISFLNIQPFLLLNL